MTKDILLRKSHNPATQSAIKRLVLQDSGYVVLYNLFAIAIAIDS